MEELRVNLPITDVTLFEDRARVKREGTVDLPAGRTVLGISGVSPVIADQTLSASADGGACEVSGIAVRRALKAPEDQDDALAGLQAELEGLKLKRDEWADTVRRIDGAAASLERISAMTADEVALDIASGRSFSDEQKALWESLDDRLAALAREKVDALAELESIDETSDDVMRLIAVRSDPSTRCDASITVDINAAAAGPRRLAIEYIVPSACWRPRHRATMTGESLRFETDGAVWQNTGEDWNGVRLSFSTHRPSLGTQVPTLEDDRISVRKKPREDLVEMRVDAVDEAGLGSGTPGSSGPDGAGALPGVDDGGVVRLFQAEQSADIPSDGRPYRVGIASFDAPADSRLAAVPELSPFALLSSRQTNATDHPILAGPVDLIRDGGFIGRTRTGYMAPGEAFLLGWGPDTGVRIHRRETTKTREAGVLNAWSRTEYTVRVKISNIGIEAKSLAVRERIPVSELERVRIAFDADATSPGRDGPDGDGILSWSVDLEPGERTERVLVYAIETRKGVVGI